MASRSKVTRIVLGAGILQRVSQTVGVQDALRARGQQIAARARQLDPTAEITVESGIRPRGRAFTNVVSNDADGEFGSATTQRRRALGRAADIQE